VKRAKWEPETPKRDTVATVVKKWALETLKKVMAAIVVKKLSSLLNFYK
jgi:hypothetical protein